MNWPTSIVALALAASIVGGGACGDTGQERVAIPVSVRGSAGDARSLGGARFTLTRAELGFGPAYFCATEGADVELCDVALAELLSTLTIDALDPETRPLATLTATTGSVRSALFDYGISWLLTRQAARPNPGAPGGHSAVLAGSVEQNGSTLAFSATVDITPFAPGDAAVNARATSHEISGHADRLTIAVDPYRWLEQVDVAQLFALDTDHDGSVVIPETAQAYQAIVQALTNTAPVEFRWNE